MSSRYSKSPTRNTKPQIIGTCSMQENDRTFVLSILQKCYKPGSSAEDRQNLQKQVSQELCKQFQKSCGVSVIEGDESYLNSMNFALKKQPTVTIVYNKLLVRIWIKENDLTPQTDYFGRNEQLRQDQ